MLSTILLVDLGLIRAGRKGLLQRYKETVTVVAEMTGRQPMDHDSHERWHEDCDECQRILAEESAYHWGMYDTAETYDSSTEGWYDKADWINMEERG